jgi:hypothetical protein
VILPRYYCPPGVARPAHLPRSYPRVDIVEGKGPDVAEGGDGGGVCWGGPLVHEEPGWKLTAAGWWLHPGECQPQHLVRMDASPRVRRWTTIDGVQAGEHWRVPLLIEQDQGSVGPDGKPTMFCSALDRVWDGAGWTAPADLVALQERLLTLAAAAAGVGREALGREDVVRLVFEILALGHHVDPSLIGARGWLSEALVLRVLLAAAGLTPTAEPA